MIREVLDCPQHNFHLGDLAAEGGGVIECDPLHIGTGARLIAPEREQTFDIGNRVSEITCPPDESKRMDIAFGIGVLSRNRRKFRQPINVACPAPGRWGRPNSRVTSRHFDHGNASRTSRPDCSGLDEAD
ncbi:hypothetical protein AA11237_2693 [Acidocella aminolytica 101 = DSM 11237]|nr:hypothetical protein AA11237_2693 [Acidocella aminolytica 101 = DSM 11237]